MKFRIKAFFVVLLAMALLAVGGNYVYSLSNTGGNSHGCCRKAVSQNLISKMVSSISGFVIAQQPDPEGDVFCERPDPNGDPNVGGTDKTRLGCTCMRKCVNGQPTENYENGKGCKVHCKPDHCKCPNPCES